MYEFFNYELVLFLKFIGIVTIIYTPIYFIVEHIKNKYKVVIDHKRKKAFFGDIDVKF